MNEPFDAESERELAEFLARSAKVTPSRALASFTDRVMARVALEPRSATTPAYVPEILAADPLPWWLRALAQPASILAFVLAGVGLALRDPLARAPFAVSEASARALQLVGPSWVRLFQPLAVASDVPGGDWALAFVALPFAALLAYAAYRAALSLATPHRAFGPAAAHRVGA